jgi:hypothetical protein
MEARPQLRHRPTLRGRLRVRKNGGASFIVPQLLCIVKLNAVTDFENGGKISILDAKRPVHTMNLNPIRISILLPLMLATCSLGAQVPASSPTPVPYASVSQLNGMLAQLEQASQTTQADLGKLRVDKWKMDSSYKKQTLANVDSIRRNLDSALPEIVTQLRNSPEDLAASFKLYRNLDALYDVLGNVAESAGAFGNKDEFQSLSNDLNALERSRRAFADRMESLTASKEGELHQLRTQLRTLQASAPPPAPKKIVVDDNEPKKPAAKKKAIPRPPKPAAASAQPAKLTPP